MQLTLHGPWALPAFHYLAGVLMLETNGSVLAVGVLHASFNASAGMDVTPGGWQYVPAVIIWRCATHTWVRS